MKWFKHDSNASLDAKLRKLKLKYGMEGYGLYWQCLEFVAMNVEKHNLTFELEHDAEIISSETNIHIDRVNEMMSFMINLDLFEQIDNRVFCLKMASRTDEYTQKLLKNQGLLSMSRQTPDSVETKSELIEENRIEENRIEENNTKGDKSPPCPYQKIVDLWHKVLHDLPAIKKLTAARKQKLKARWNEYPDLNQWETLFEEIRESNFLMGRTRPQEGRPPFELTIDFLISESNFVKILEGKYHR